MTTPIKKLMLAMAVALALCFGARADGTHDSVQLWEGGPYWAATNIGAEEPEDAGYVTDSTLGGQGSHGLYWSSDPSTLTGYALYAWYLSSASDGFGMYNFGTRITGQSVRPIQMAQMATLDITWLDDSGTTIDTTNVYAADTVDGLKTASALTEGVAIENKSAVKSTIQVTAPSGKDSQFFKVKFGD